MKNQELTNDRDRVYEAADIVEVASVYTALKQRGGKFVGLCPFHQEKTPSFSVDRPKKLYHCFGCHRGGDVFRLLMEMERVSFPEALRHLADRYHIELTGGKDRGPGASERKRLVQVNELALKFYQKCLESPEGRAARELLVRRGVKPEFVAQMRLGYAPAQWDRLHAHLRREGLPDDLIVRAGLVVEKQSGGSYYDRFRDRLIFPIFSEGGEVIAFGGRVLVQGAAAAGVPKFINSPETALYSKGRGLYGLNLSRDEIRKSGEAVIVEGYMDFVLLHQEGVKNCVASLGTSLTRPQVRLIARHGASGILNFDPDPAGREAVIRSIEIFFEEDVGVRVLSLPEGLDPDEFILKERASAYAELIASAPSGEIFALDTLYASYRAHESQRRVSDVTEFLKLCRHMSNGIRQEMALREASARFGMSIEQMRGQMEKLQISVAPAADVSTHGTPLGRPNPAETCLLIYCLRSVENCREVAKEISQLPALVCRTTFQKLIMLTSREGHYDQDHVFSVLDSSEAAQLSLVLMEREETGWPDREQARSCLDALRNVSGEAAALQSAVERAESESGLLEEALARKQDFVRKRHALAK